MTLDQALKDGCKPRKITEQGEWYWWACTCADKKHGTKSEEAIQYFGDSYIDEDK